MLISASIAINNDNPTLIIDTSGLGECTVHLQCFTGTALLGNENVSLTSGFQLNPGSDNVNRNVVVKLQQGEKLYAIAWNVEEMIVSYLAYSA